MTLKSMAMKAGLAGALLLAGTAAGFAAESKAPTLKTSNP